MFIIIFQRHQFGILFLAIHVRIQIRMGSLLNICLDEDSIRVSSDCKGYTHFRTAEKQVSPNQNQVT